MKTRDKLYRLGVSRIQVFRSILPWLKATMKVSLENGSTRKYKLSVPSNGTDRELVDALNRGAEEYLMKARKCEEQAEYFSIAAEEAFYSTLIRTPE